jgi:lipopolysaccharide export system protein LptA
MPTNTATITGNVVVSQGPNVIRGEKLVVDLNTGFSRMEAGGKAGSTRVQGLFVPNTLKKDGKSKKTNQPQQQSKQ